MLIIQSIERYIGIGGNFVCKSLNNVGTSISESIRLYKKGKSPWPEGEEGLKARDYKRIVGGKWDQLGRLQFDFMLSQGLRPEHIFSPS